MLRLSRVLLPGQAVICDATNRTILPGEWYYYDDERKVNICIEYMDQYKKRAQTLNLLPQAMQMIDVETDYKLRMTMRKQNSMQAALDLMNSMLDQ